MGIKNSKVINNQTLSPNEINALHSTNNNLSNMEEIKLSDEKCDKAHRYGWRCSCHTQCFQQNFKNWTSGNRDIDEFIQIVQLNAKSYNEVLEWIECDRFENVEYLAKGGFGTTSKAIWRDGNINGWHSTNNQWNRSGEITVALKCLHNSQDSTFEFLREVALHLKMNDAHCVVTCYGITKNPETNDFTMVMRFAEYGDLRKLLNNRFNSLNWKQKIYILYMITVGLKNIHDHKLIHQDFHCGNILSGCFHYGSASELLITDMGLCQPANVKPPQSDDKKIYGVLPYVAPEVLRKKEYTQASDIYGFGIIAYEVCTGLPSYHDTAHDEFLTIRICQGLRPKSNYKVPQLILNVIKQCWDADPLKRPEVGELMNLFLNLYNKISDCSRFYDRNSLIYKQVKEADEINKQLSSSTAASPSSTGILSYTTHTQAVYTSRLLDYKNLPIPKNADDIETEYSESTRVDFTNLNIISKDKNENDKFLRI